MLLEDATSKEQVAAALAADDEELAEDIEFQLDQAQREWEAKPDYCEEDSIEIENFLESDDFVNEVIEQSPVYGPINEAAAGPARGRRCRTARAPA
jgi:hypothetical protein